MTLRNYSKMTIINLIQKTKKKDFKEEISISKHVKQESQNSSWFPSLFGKSNPKKAEELDTKLVELNKNPKEFSKRMKELPSKNKYQKKYENFQNFNNEISNLSMPSKITLRNKLSL